MRKRPVLTYNILLPIWLLIWFPSWLWLLLIPANYLIDRIVLHWSLKGLDDRNAFCRRATWKIWRFSCACWRGAPPPTPGRCARAARRAW